MKKRWRVYGGLFAILALVASGVYLANHPQLFGAPAQAKGEQSDEAKKKEGENTVPVQLVSVERGPISSYINSSGNLRAMRDIEVATQLEGVVRSVNVEEGEFVEQGRVLATLDDAQLKITLDLTRAKLSQARIQHEKAELRAGKLDIQAANARVEAERYQEAYRQGVVSAAEMATRKYTLDEFEQESKVAQTETREFGQRVKELEAEIAQAELQVARTEIKAPFAGFITRRNIEIGQRVRNLDSLYNLGAFSPLYADIYVSERDSRAVRSGQQVGFWLGSDGLDEDRGVVERVSPVVDQGTGTVKVTVRLEQRGKGFRPGSFVRVAIQTDVRQDAVLVPKRALLEEDGQHFIFIADGDTATKMKVDIGYISNSQVEIRGGLKEGQKVVVAGQGAIKEDSKIKEIQS